MTDDSVGGVIERAHVAASRGAWQEAFDLFTQADAGSLLATEDLPMFGNVADTSVLLRTTKSALGVWCWPPMIESPHSMKLRL